ncbi:Cation/H+ exchanger [Penicillium frequentans]|uniref:Cation/H+ exchanger n=1 Tax=Penicillium frequentans TaxID=3151616 RepID=A0AAD6D263_9EURO|nr:Cation/H+ exchanger [Penicillium glabrum]
MLFFSIAVHGLSVPALSSVYEGLKVPTIRDHPVEIDFLSETEPIPNNSVVNCEGYFMVINNCFSCVS